MRWNEQTKKRTIIILEARCKAARDESESTYYHYWRTWRNITDGLIVSTRVKRRNSGSSVTASTWGVTIWIEMMDLEMLKNQLRRNHISDRRMSQSEKKAQQGRRIRIRNNDESWRRMIGWWTLTDCTGKVRKSMLWIIECAIVWIECARQGRKYGWLIIWNVWMDKREGSTQHLGSKLTMWYLGCLRR